MSSAAPEAIKRARRPKPRPAPNAVERTIESIYKQHKLGFEILGALVSMVTSALGLFFVYRWAKLLEKSDREVRVSLLGTFAADLIQDDISLISAIAALYIGLKLFFWLVSAAKWQHYLEVQQRQIDKAHYAALRVAARIKETNTATTAAAAAPP